jgi:hypothetical protein
MDFYNLASRVWNLTLFAGSNNSRVLEYVGIARDTEAAALFANCQPLTERISFMNASSSYPANDARTLIEIGRDLGDRKDDLVWGCASAHVAVAEAIASKEN